VADAVGIKDPQHSLKHPQLEAEDEAVADEEAVREGKVPPALEEKGAASKAEQDIDPPAAPSPARGLDRKGSTQLPPAGGAS
jgi:hypothetical protein